MHIFLFSLLLVCKEWGGKNESTYILICFFVIKKALVKAKVKKSRITQLYCKCAGACNGVEGHSGSVRAPIRVRGHSYMKEASKTAGVIFKIAGLYS